MKVLLVHGFVLSGTGSCMSHIFPSHVNFLGLFVHNLIKNLVSYGVDVYFFSISSRLERFPFISESYEYTTLKNDEYKVHFKRDSTFKGQCFHIKPFLNNHIYTVLNKNWEGWTGEVSYLKDIKSREEADLFCKYNYTAIKNFLGTVKVDLIISNHMVLQPVYCCWLQKEYSCKHITYIHGSCLNFCVKKNKVLDSYTEEIARSVDRFAFLSKNSSNEFIEYCEKFGVAEKCMVCSPGVNIELFRINSDVNAVVKSIQDILPKYDIGRTKVSLDGFREKFKVGGDSAFIVDEFNENIKVKSDGYDEGFFERFRNIDFEKSKVVIYFGRFLFTKGVQHIVLAIPKILKKHPNTVVLFTGFGQGRIYLEALINSMHYANKKLFCELLRNPKKYQNSPSFEEFNSIKKFLEEEDIDEYLKQTKGVLFDHVIITGLLSHEVLSKVLSICDMSILPSIFPEAFGLVSIESLSTGCVPLTTHHSGFANCFDFYEDLFINEPLNFKNKFRKLILDENLVDNMVHDSNLILERIDIIKKEKKILAMKKSLRKVVLDYFNWTKHIETLLSVCSSQ